MELRIGTLLASLSCEGTATPPVEPLAPTHLLDYTSGKENEILVSGGRARLHGPQVRFEAWLPQYGVFFRETGGVELRAEEYFPPLSPDDEFLDFHIPDLFAGTWQVLARNENGESILPVDFVYQDTIPRPEPEAFFNVSRGSADSYFHPGEIGQVTGQNLLIPGGTNQGVFFYQEDGGLSYPAVLRRVEANRLEFDIPDLPPGGCRIHVVVGDKRNLYLGSLEGLEYDPGV